MKYNTLDERTCDIDLVLAAAEYFGLSDTKVTKGWAAEAKKHGAPAAEIRRLESAFDHEDLAKALALLPLVSTYPRSPYPANQKDAQTRA
jgi:crotonobetainyl-CoA:carnitine CoA-transferase CaiB-like acyl-CoA transferase